MARKYGRIKTSIWIDDDFRQLTDAAQALYLRLISAQSINAVGVGDWRPNRLAMLARDLTPAKVKKAADELHRRRYIVWDDESEEVVIRTFVRHDGMLASPKSAAGVAAAYREVHSPKLREIVSDELRKLRDELPELAGWDALSEALSYRADTPSHGVSDALSDGVPDRADAPEALILKPETTSSTAVDALFEDWWKHYPRKVDKGHARTAFKTALKRTDIDTLTAGVQRFAASVNGKDPKFIAHAATWLNGERWNDDTTPTPAYDPDAWLRS